MELEIGQIMEILPHRQPFLLIDAVEELEPGKRAVARKCVSYNEPYFGGHFPGEPGDARGTDCRGTGADRCGGNLKYGGKLWKDRVFCGD